MNVRTFSSKCATSGARGLNNAGAIYGGESIQIGDNYVESGKVLLCMKP